MNPSDNPFTALSLIAAPAVLTNACSVLIMSTSNRLGRVIDRARVLSKELEIHHPANDTDPDTPLETLALHELRAAERRSLILVRALQFFYVALSGFAGAAFLSLLGAVLIRNGSVALVLTLELSAVIVGFGAVVALISGAVLLVRESRIAVGILHEQAQHIERRIEQRLQTPQLP